MSLALADPPRDHDRMLHQLRQMKEVIVQQNASLASLQAYHDTVLAERDAARAERDLVREERDAAQAEIEKLRFLIRQLHFGNNHGRGPSIRRGGTIVPEGSGGTMVRTFRRERPARDADAGTFRGLTAQAC